MNQLTPSTPFPLAKGGVATFSDAVATRIRCERGSLWITQDNDTRDIVLRAGEQFQPDRKGTVLIYALERSTLSWSAATTAPAPSSTWKSLGSWLAAHFADRISIFVPEPRRTAFE